MRTTHDSPSRVDWAPLSDHDEQALEAIRRQLDMEFPHFSGSIAVAPAVERPAPRRRGRAATALGLLLACAGGFLATVLFITLHQTLKAPLAVDRQSAPAAPVPVTRVVAATPPAGTVLADTSANPSATTVPAEPSTKPPRSERASATAPRLQRTNSTPARPVPDVIRVTEVVPPRREAAAVAPVAARAVAAPPPGAAPSPVTAPPAVTAPAVTAPPPVAAPPVVAVTPPVTTPPPVQPLARAAPTPTTSPPPQERPLAERARATLMQTPEQVRGAWETVRERVVRSPAWEIVRERMGRSPGEISAPPRGGVDAP